MRCRRTSRRMWRPRQARWRSPPQCSCRPRRPRRAAPARSTSRSSSRRPARCGAAGPARLPQGAARMCEPLVACSLGSLRLLPLQHVGSSVPLNNQAQASVHGRTASWAAGVRTRRAPAEGPSRKRGRARCEGCRRACDAGSDPAGRLPDPERPAAGRPAAQRARRRVRAGVQRQLRRAGSQQRVHQCAHFTQAGQLFCLRPTQSHGNHLRLHSRKRACGLLARLSAHKCSVLGSSCTWRKIQQGE